MEKKLKAKSIFNRNEHKSSITFPRYFSKGNEEYIPLNALIYTTKFFLIVYDILKKNYSYK